MIESMNECFEVSMCFDFEYWDCFGLCSVEMECYVFWCFECRFIVGWRQIVLQCDVVVVVGCVDVFFDWKLQLNELFGESCDDVVFGCI